jgi:hypothetical protein
LITSLGRLTIGAAKALALPARRRADQGPPQAAHRRRADNGRRYPDDDHRLHLLFSLIFVPFGGWFVGSSLSPADYPTPVGAGVAALLGGTVLTLPFLFDLFRLPADLFQMFITVDVIASRFGTLPSPRTRC